MEGKFGGEWIRVCVWLHSFTAQMKLSQYCWFAIARYNIKSSKREKKNCEEVAEGREMGRDHRGITHHTQELSFFFRATTWGSVPLTLWESEALCRLYSTFGQTRNHSPVCKPPVLQDIGNLEQETTVTHTHITEPHTPLTRLGMERLQNMETVLLAQVCTKPHIPDVHRSGEGILHVNIFKRNPFFPRRLCSPNIMYFSENPSGLQSQW